MNILLVLIPVTALVVLVGIALFFWAVNHHQFDDLDTPGSVPLLDDPAADSEATEPSLEHPSQQSSQHPPEPPAA